MPVYIANLVEDALVVLPTVLLALASCIFVRRRKDPARSAFLWLHIALIIYLVSDSLFTNPLPDGWH